MDSYPSAVPSRRRSFGDIFTMNFGFLGIQFGWGLQMANMSAIYEKLGAQPDEIPLLWLAAPMTGLIVQPIVGALSDRTWTRLGRRRPYFLTGAILASLALFAMPHAPALWVAATLLWVLDSSINISMEPFRAFVADRLDDEQRPLGFVMQSFFIGVGATLANVLPYILREWLDITGRAANGVPLATLYSFQLGAAAFLGAVLVTVLTTPEDPPPDPEAFHRAKAQSGPFDWVGDIGNALTAMPSVMKRLAVVQVLTWLGLFCMWLFFGPAIARHIFGAADPAAPAYDEGINWGGICFATYSVVCFVVAFALPKLAARHGCATVHAIALTCGGLGLLSTGLVANRYWLLVAMVGVGIAWASILSMPYAILARALPGHRMGVFMGVFNFFIVLPEIAAALTFQPLVKYVFGGNPLYVVLLGGASLLAAAGATLFVERPATATAYRPV
ncbi:MFS transporter [Chloracidobacterium sp. D]|uniref:MFS transporter n=1 Tax=Chloracidobacterium sp. D TaxID=2821536 RepID=UPI002016ADC9|nr:MFS transporter [Chloracidobacterium sp. D]